MKYVIIGNGPASVGAIEGIRRYDFDGAITVIGKEKFPAFSRAMVPYYLSGRVSYEKLSIRNFDYYTERGVELCLDCSAELVDTQKKVVFLSSGTEISYDSLLLATGNRSRQHNFANCLQDNYYDAFSLTDIENLREKISVSKRAIVLGDGVEALSIAEVLSLNGIEVIVLCQGHLLPELFDNNCSEILEKRMLGFGVTVFSDSTIKKVVKSSDDKLKGVLLGTGLFREADFIVNAAPGKPVLISGIDEIVSYGSENKFIMSSEDASVFLSGNLINKSSSFFASSYNYGVCAGLSMASVDMDIKNVYKSPVRSINVFGINISAGGAVEVDSPKVEKLEYIDKDNCLFRKLFIKNNELNGYCIVGDRGFAGLYSGLLRSGLKFDRSSALFLLKEGVMSFFAENNLYPDLLKS
ncbi:NAD(P)/FAD-dependent oxidoreductase [Maridesulfovibrio bastinii]|uniref:NAD(P)/FAD-dependent oxidoreductase n=1 Tax=Maridesulfovibrio bastinii TaxID=47157 RepID=UPI0004032053|nr:FAD-dependent oxidoreductase [Maridesulfovibrio bastinii]